MLRPCEGVFPLPAFRREGMEIPEGTRAFNVLRSHRGGGKERGRVGNRFQISMKSELRPSDSLMLPPFCSDDGGRCFAGEVF